MERALGKGFANSSFFKRARKICDANGIGHLLHYNVGNGRRLTISGDGSCVSINAAFKTSEEFMQFIEYRVIGVKPK